MTFFRKIFFLFFLLFLRRRGGENSIAKMEGTPLRDWPPLDRLRVRRVVDNTLAGGAGEPCSRPVYLWCKNSMYTIIFMRINKQINKLIRTFFFISRDTLY